jgi:hypothetical protein
VSGREAELGNSYKPPHEQHGDIHAVCGGAKSRSRWRRALHLAVISRIRLDVKTRAYVAKKTAEGHSKLEIIGCLKRYVARETYFLLNPGRTTITPHTRQRSKIA